MHTCPHLGINMDLVDELVKTFTWVPPLAAESDGSKESLSGPEEITDEELAEAFDAIDHKKVEAHQAEVTSAVDPDLKLDGNEVLEGKVYDWKVSYPMSCKSTPLLWSPLRTKSAFLPISKSAFCFSIFSASPLFCFSLILLFPCLVPYHSYI
ncbi:hypothetical protein PAXRUDRAFT_177013 [Paxillus rubicundulus Ve08.2h10]|uniref:Uncharacterized protein n=1 Tax=Paxillus rubicundulus Ve08.2h10 TaxID=930991 RepID=A0A0D0CEU6_9AGAM|nr:hypothetical protein PAXRUDRAFT_177013 [Paxillus rubicundulus Ve08.2h10]